MNTSQELQRKVQTEPDSLTYKAAVIDRPRSIKYVEMTKPDCEKDEILVKLEGVGICASNIPVWEGREWFEYPLAPGVPGHEGWGIIEKIGEDVKDFEVGQRVALLQGNVFSEYAVVSADNAVAISPQLEGPFPGEPFGCLMNIFQRADIKKGQTVAIIGLGFIGQGLVKLCKKKGAIVIGISRRDSSLHSAAGEADFCVKMDDHFKIIKTLQEQTNGMGCDTVIESTGKQWPLDLASEIIGDYGRLIIAGYHQDGIRKVNMQQWNWKALDVINAHERDSEKYKKGILSAIEAVEAGILEPGKLLTHSFTFEQLAEALDLVALCPEGFIKGYIRF